jgi:hypothetical protein
LFLFFNKSLYNSIRYIFGSLVSVFDFVLTRYLVNLYLFRVHDDEIHVFLDSDGFSISEAAHLNEYEHPVKEADHAKHCRDKRINVEDFR